MIGQLFVNDSKRLQVDNVELSDGDSLRVLVADETGKAEWVTCTVEHNGQEYYLTGLFGYQISGLFANVE